MNMEGLTKDETFSISISICNWAVVPAGAHIRLELCTDSAEFAKGIQMVSMKGGIPERAEEKWPGNGWQSPHNFFNPEDGLCRYSCFIVTVDVVGNCSMNAIKWGCVIKCEVKVGTW